MGRLDNKVAIITAAASGMGQASALVFAREGAKVVVSDIDVAKGQETVDLIKKEGGDAIFVKVDVTKMEDLDAVVKAAVDTYGKLDILFNHAGLPGPFDVEDLTEEEWDKSLFVNLKGPFFLMAKALPEIRRAGGGSIIFTASTAGLIGSAFSPTYSAGKGGVVNMVRALALRLAPEIRVNCVCPGSAYTPMQSKFLTPPGTTPEQLEERQKGLLGAIPMRRLVNPEDLAYAALYLACDESAYITGIALPVDGGFLCR